MTARSRRLRVALFGAVQGVGFRPFVHRLASSLGLTGWVLNSGAGLVVEAEGPAEDLDFFLKRLDSERPAAAVVMTWEVSWLDTAGYSRFEILPSDETAEKTTSILPDLATCADCRSEMLDPSDRRYLYPFTNCTHCGPRYTIILDLPYDRPHTTMKAFTLCQECRREYEDPLDRRFHAQPNACPVCGPKLNQSVRAAADAIRRGEIIALKGIGGFQLLVDARNAEAVGRLRRLKNREEKPFALMAPSIEAAREICFVSAEEEALLLSSAAPIVLLNPKLSSGIASNVAHHSQYLGVMLPYSPLHHLLMLDCPIPVIATSGNRSDEPIATDNQEAQQRLGHIANFFLMHDRPVARPCDDSVAQLVRGRQSVVRRARGYAPLPVWVPKDLPEVLAVGGHLKNTVAIAVGRQVFLSQHIGDLDTPEARRWFERAIDDLCRLYRFAPRAVACDMHPDYASTLWARNSGLPVVPVQHHHAHAAACAAENDVCGPYLAVSWDGTGFGLDGSVWGGEFFLWEGARFERVAHLRPYRLPGGEAAVREGWRVAASLLWEALGPEAVPNSPQKLILCKMLERGINAPLSTSVGRLFDAVSSLTGIAHENRFEGQAAMMLERLIAASRGCDAYPLPESHDVADWQPLVSAVLDDSRRGVDRGLISLRYHNALANWIVAVARRIGTPQVVLSGGVFLNRYLLERAAALLEEAGFRVFSHQRVPTGDGGIALGQAVLAGWRV